MPWQHVPVKVVELCRDSALWVKQKTFAWDEIGVRFHHRLVSIHPFPNGNGRFARLMTDVLLFNADQPLFSWGATTLTAPGQAREQYISALKAADERDLRPLITFVRA